MKTLSWNCRGLGNQATVRALSKILQLQQPEIVFLMETKRTAQEMRTLNQRFFRFKGCMAVDCGRSGRARSGGIVMLWAESMELTLISYSSNHLMFMAKATSKDLYWYISGIYGWPDCNNRWRTWDLMNQIRRDSTEMWCCMGDFNEVMWSYEKKGGVQRNLMAMRRFREAIESAQLQEIQCSEKNFTWSNNRIGEENIKEKLDRIFVNESWRQYFPYNHLKYLPRYKSDHSPIILTYDVDGEEPDKRRKKRKFRFEEMWNRHPEFGNFLSNTWQNFPKDLCFHEKMQHCGEAMLTWDNMTFGSVKRKIRDLNEKIEKVQEKEQTEENLEEYRRLESELDDVLKNEEIMWRQRSRTTWLKDGDRNTKFFHEKANQRQKRNEIKRLKTADGVWLTKQEDLMESLKDYFKSLFTSDSTNYRRAVMDCVEVCVSHQMNEELEKPFTEKEIQKALQQMHPSKAPGPDGMTPYFFQKFWNIVGGDVLTTALHILNENGDISELNKTNIVLIPKINNPDSPKDFRPISLCNVIVRIVTKCLANRLKNILHLVISPNQSAFIPGRSITDNTMTAFEIFHSMKKKRKGRHGCMAMKLDLSKAYDRVEWEFLKDVMLKMGFSHIWVGKVMQCVSSVTYSVLVNGQSSDFFSPGRGLRQGDPLSPYLFLICADVFSRMIHKAEMNGRIHGFQIARNAPSVTHLLFADDSILFFRANRKELLEVQDIIRKYETASGQMINFEKTEITLSRNVTEEKREELCTLAGTNGESHIQKYLGMPTEIGRSKKQIFTNILEKVQRKCKGWKEKYLSKAGREIMVKAVLQAIPTYMMSCFLLPNEVLHEIEMTMARFFWGSKEGERRIHWVGWNGLTKRKEQGGLGFRNLRCFNLAMLARQFWRLIHNQDSIIFKIMKAKYFPKDDVLKAKIGYRPSYLWRSILSSREGGKEGMAWRLGNGESIIAATDKWVGSPPPMRPSWGEGQLSQEMMVSDLIDKEHFCWNEELVRETFLIDADRILAMPISHRLPPDRLVWGVTKDGRFSVRSAYRVAVNLHKMNEEGTSMEQPASTNIWSQLWNLKLTPKIASFVWQVCHEALPTLTNLARRGVRMDPICRLCGEEVETHNHLFLHCRVTQILWKACALRFQEMNSMESVRSFLGNSLLHFPKEVNQLIVLVAWHIWIMRNRLIFDGKHWDLEEILVRIDRVWNEFREIMQNPRRPTRSPMAINEKAWSPPPTGWLKLDTDVNVISPTVIGMGFLLRDSDGRILLAGRHESRAGGSSIVLEGLGVMYALKTTLAYNFDGVVVGNDNQELMWALKGKRNVGEFEVPIVEDILSLIKKESRISFEYNSRELNFAAHHMARGPSGFFVNVIPPHIRRFV